MSHMVSEIHRISDAYSYVPLITETSGLLAITEGACLLGISGALKINEYFTCRKATIFPPSYPHISYDAAHVYAEFGKADITYGLEKIAPAICVLLTIYAIKF